MIKKGGLPESEFFQLSPEIQVIYLSKGSGNSNKDIGDYYLEPVFGTNLVPLKHLPNNRQ